MLLSISFSYLIIFKSVFLTLSPSDFVKAFYEKSDNAELIKVDLFVIQNLTIDEIDLQEDFKNLETFQYSDYLFELSQQPTKLVPSPQSFEVNDSIFPQIRIQPIDRQINSNSDVVNKAEITDVKPYLYERVPFQKEVLDIKSNLDRSRDYRVLYYNSWYQPSEKKDISIPVYIEAEKKGKKVYGEIKIYKERFFHLDSHIRLAEKTEDLIKESIKPNLSNFEELFEQNKIISEKKVKENNYWIETIFNSVKLNYENLGNLVISEQEKDLGITEILEEYQYRDLYEIKKEIKLEPVTFNFVDHPYFSILVRVEEYQLN